MSQPKNKLLTALSALGLVAGGTLAADDAAAQSYGSFAEFFDYVGVAATKDVRAQVEFARAYPKSPAAARIARQLAAEIQSLPPAERAATVNEVRSLGGLPKDIAGVAGTSLDTTAPATASATTTTSTQTVSASKPGATVSRPSGFSNVFGGPSLSSAATGSTSKGPSSKGPSSNASSSSGRDSVY